MEDEPLNQLLECSEVELKCLILLNGKSLNLIDFSSLENISKGFKI